MKDIIIQNGLTIFNNNPNKIENFIIYIYSTKLKLEDFKPYIAKSDYGFIEFCIKEKRNLKLIRNLKLSKIV